MKHFFPKNLSIFLLFLVLTITIFALDQGNFLNTFKSGVLRATQPFLKTTHQIDLKLVHPLRFFLTYQQKKEDLENLKKQKMEFESLRVKLANLEEENKFLKKALELQEKDARKFQVANIIGRADEAGHVIYIDIGRQDNIKQEDVVILPDNFLIGKVSKVFETMSQVIIVTHPNFSAAVKGGTTKTQGLLTGQGNALEVEVINYEDDPQKEEVYLTSGMDESFPPNLITGKATKIIKKPTEISKTVILKPLVELKKIEKVLVLQK